MESVRGISRCLVPVIILIFLILCSCHKNSTGDNAAAEEALTAQLVSPSINSIAMQGQAVTFTGSAINGSEPYQYSWSLDGEHIYATGNPLILPFDMPGTYKVTLVVKDALNATASLTAMVQVINAERMESSFMCAGTNHTLAIVSGAALWAWGYNFYGELGDGEWTDQHLPVKTLSDTEFTSVSASDYSSIALDPGGNIWAWGYAPFPNYHIWNKKNVPVIIASDGDWRSISAGSGNYLLAIKYNNTLWMMDLSTADMVKMNEEMDWQMVSNGPSHVCAVKTDGTLYTWGNNDYGQLGIGFKDGTGNPQKVDLNNACLGVSSGGRHTVALLSDGTIWAWGDNTYGQLGNETNSTSWDPIQVGKDSDWIAVAAGSYHTLALKSNGTLWAWGDNAYGQLGDGTFQSSNKPVQVKSDITWVAFNSRYDHVIALKSDGTYWTWGENGTGQVGNGSVENAGIPVMVHF